ncbi:unnamed protein product [Prorocentrum cordatum]|uniref:Uncharacterized protein n=1 Tax=Prorocentrum cordatum TaxID=2364126 RepID=A0ABN9Y7Y1_9DINO|nr:unnamed protein product [Polarella glacialis]
MKEHGAPPQRKGFLLQGADCMQPLLLRLKGSLPHKPASELLGTGASRRAPCTAGNIPGRRRHRRHDSAYSSSRARTSGSVHAGVLNTGSREWPAEQGEVALEPFAAAFGDFECSLWPQLARLGRAEVRLDWQGASPNVHFISGR